MPRARGGGRRGRSLRVWAVAVALTMGAAGCGAESHEDPEDPRGRLLLQPGELPEPYSPGLGPGSGPLDLEQATVATPADAETMRAALGEAGFQGAYSRVWMGERDRVVALVYELLTDVGAREIVELQRREIAVRGGVVYSDEAVPQGFAFRVGGMTPGDAEAPLFCQGYWFSARQLAFLIQSCGPGPGSTDLPRELARRQIEGVLD